MGIYDAQKRKAPTHTSDSPTIHQSKSSPYDSLMQMASLVGNSAMEAYLRQDAAPQSNVLASENGGRELPTALRERFEKRLGVSLDDVRVHYNSDKPKQLGALAYARGREVHIGPGQEDTLEHELGHVVQQKRGEVKKTGVLHGAAINEENTLEANANSVINDAACNSDGFVSILNSESVIQFCGKNSKEYWEKNKTALLQGISSWDGWAPLCFNPKSSTMTFQRTWEGKVIRAHVHYIDDDKHPIAGKGWIQGVEGFDFTTPSILVQNAPSFIDAQKISPPPQHKSTVKKK